MANHDISIDRRFKDGVDCFCVDHPHQHVSRSEPAEVTWITKETPVTVWFPDEKLFGKQQIHIDARSKRTLPVAGSAKPRDYPYVVYCEAWEGSVGSEKAFAEGHSHPIIIVDDD